MIDKLLSSSSGTSTAADRRPLENRVECNVRADDFGDERDEDEEKDNKPLDLRTWQEHEAWLAGAIARRAQDAGLIANTDEFDWEYHQEFDAYIHGAEEKAAQTGTGQVPEAANPAEELNPGGTSSASPDSSGSNGGEAGTDFGSTSFGDLSSGFGGANLNF